jgi:hypothetical protein
MPDPLQVRNRSSGLAHQRVLDRRARHPAEHLLHSLVDFGEGQIASRLSQDSDYGIADGAEASSAVFGSV